MASQKFFGCDKIGIVDIRLAVARPGQAFGGRDKEYL